MTRKEHLKWCKDRALEYVDDNDLKQAYASMMSDMTKHPETINHPATREGFILMMSGDLDTPEKMRKFINGFN